MLEEYLEETFNDSQVGPGLLGDWRFNAAVLEAICEYLVLADLKAFRGVCKAWAIAGAVPLSKRSKITKPVRAWNSRWKIPTILLDQQPFRTYSAIDFSRLKKLLYIENPALFKTGFWIRHAELDWNLQDGKPWGTDKEVFEGWLPVLNCEQLKLLASLKFECCPAQVVAKLFLPYYLPTCWRQLKLLEFRSSKLHGMKEVNLELPGQMPTPTMLELERFEVDYVANYEYDFEILKYCSKLKSLKLGVREDLLSYAGKKQQNNLISSLEQIKGAMKGKNIIHLDLWLEFEFTLGDAWKTFFSQLINSNQSSIEHLKLATPIKIIHLSSLFDDLPYLPRLESCQLVCVTEFFTWRTNRIHCFNQLISVLATKGYLKAGDFHLALFLGGYDTVKWSSKNSRKVTIQANFTMDDLLPYFLQDFAEIMKRAYPEINYVCCPSQRITLKPPLKTMTTAIFERLGNENIFDVPRLVSEWKSLKLPKAAKLPVGGFQADGCLEPFRTNILSSNNEVQIIKLKSELDTDKDRTILCFDTIENLSQAWEQVQNSDHSWSSISARFTPAVVETGNGGYSFARIFKSCSSSPNAIIQIENNDRRYVVAKIAKFCTKVFTTIRTNKWRAEQ